MHKQELDEEVRHRERLDTKLRGLARKVKQLEQERDDLRSAVLMLIEKGGCMSYKLLEKRVKRRILIVGCCGVSL